MKKKLPLKRVLGRLGDALYATGDAIKAVASYLKDDNGKPTVLDDQKDDDESSAM